MNKSLNVIFPEEQWEKFCEIVDQETHVCKAHKNLLKELCYQCIRKTAIENRLYKE